MPVGWLTMGTPEDLQELLSRDPAAFEAEVDRRVTDAGAVTLGIFWDYAGTPAHVVVAVPARNADQVFATLADVFESRVTKLLNIHELKRLRPSGS
jgi:hypothetical protein